MNEKEIIDRIEVLRSAISYYKECHTPIPQKWIDELKDLRDRLHYPTTGKEVFNEGDKVWAPGIDGDKNYGTLHKNTEYPHVSEWYIKYDDGEECAALDMFYVNHATGKEVTAIQGLIEIVEMDADNHIEISMKVFYTMLTKALVKEKQQITEAFTSGQANIADIFFDEDGLNYFTTTYKKI